MAITYKLFRIYVWHLEREKNWVAEGKWFRQDDMDDCSIEGTIGNEYFMKHNLNQAVEEVLQVAKELNIQVRKDIQLQYNPEFLHWNEEERGESNPFPQPKNADEMIEFERKKRGWK